LRVGRRVNAVGGLRPSRDGCRGGSHVRAGRRGDVRWGACNGLGPQGLQTQGASRSHWGVPPRPTRRRAPCVRPRYYAGCWVSRSCTSRMHTSRPTARWRSGCGRRGGGHAVGRAAVGHRGTTGGRCGSGSTFRGAAPRCGCSMRRGGFPVVSAGCGWSGCLGRWGTACSRRRWKS
jgi:hypothetical protein